MSKWTLYQVLIVLGFSLAIIVMNVFAETISALFTFIKSFIEPSILIIFFTVILIVWGFSFLLLLQEKKGRPLFVHKIWRIMPAIIGVILFISFIVFIILGVTILSQVTPEMHWILDLSIVYFLVLIYIFILSIMLRYGKADTRKGTIINSAHVTVLVLLAIIFMIPKL
ncbi:hypothetical protein JSQ81_07050 [Sporosarcina sp. Marseille-Q4063]|uniref:hypothetical protein n=1 Tax=Sporosarcina sp. Marseille-Q4063 TaxID=2810514 RepID=UPI001BAF62FD|nr:hypothetical protein [Sporosarcina sp. Marseille-Q4063]QUW23286.1 hypothetical protein JSQ81_07050 [Sporosarcina sp. Marseille-Q4063]